MKFASRSLQLRRAHQSESRSRNSAPSTLDSSDWAANSFFLLLSRGFVCDEVKLSAHTVLKQFLTCSARRGLELELTSVQPGELEHFRAAFSSAWKDLIECVTFRHMNRVKKEEREQASCNPWQLASLSESQGARHARTKQIFPDSVLLLALGKRRARRLLTPPALSASIASYASFTTKFE